LKRNQIADEQTLQSEAISYFIETIAPDT
jgi:hypothetical protein